MSISAPCVVSLTWKMTDAQNHDIDVLQEPVEFFYGGDDLLVQVEEALLGRKAGDEVRLQLEPEHAFGEYKAELVCFEDRALFPEQLEEGMTFEGLPAGHATPDMPADVIYVVTDIFPTHVVLDGNHPLAGKALRLIIQVKDVREASDEEVEARSVGNNAFSVLDPHAGHEHDHHHHDHHGHHHGHDHGDDDGHGHGHLH